MRTVSNDNVVSFEGTGYEVPRGSAGERICVTCHHLRGDILKVLHEGKEVRLHLTDLVANANARRGRPRSPQDSFSAKPSETAAQMRYDADLEPLVDSDGGYQKGPDDDD